MNVDTRTVVFRAGGEDGDEEEDMVELTRYRAETQRKKPRR